MNGQANHPKSMSAAQDCGLIILRRKDLYILYLNPAMAQARPDVRPGLLCSQVWPQLFTPTGELVASLATDDGATRVELCAAPLEWAGEPALAITLRPLAPTSGMQEETQRQLEQAQRLYRADIKARAEVLLEYDLTTDSFIPHTGAVEKAIRTVVVFDYDLARDQAGFSSPFHTDFGREGEIDRVAWRIGQGDLIHQADRQVALRIVEKCRQQPVCVKGCLRLKTRHGRYAWFELYANALWDAQKTRCLNIVGRLINIDELKNEATQWRKQAKLDALTGLYNRAALQELAERLLVDGAKPGALIFIDIDNFKTINDTLGHTAGDEVLHTIAQRIRRCFRKEDLAARYGGDEFVVYLQNDLTQEALENKLRQLQAIFHGDPLLRRFNSSASMGVARFPEDAGDFDTLLQRADRALYCAKQLGKDRYAFYADCQQAGLV